MGVGSCAWLLQLGPCPLRLELGQTAGEAWESPPHLPHHGEQSAGEGQGAREPHSLLTSLWVSRPSLCLPRRVPWWPSSGLSGCARPGTGRPRPGSPTALPASAWGSGQVWVSGPSSLSQATWSPAPRSRRLQAVFLLLALPAPPYEPSLGDPSPHTRLLPTHLLPRTPGFSPHLAPSLWSLGPCPLQED